ncbi:MAG: hypothetical protein ACJ74W_10385 [Pyrinomonadaceae bacterium]
MKKITLVTALVMLALIGGAIMDGHLQRAHAQMYSSSARRAADATFAQLSPATNGSVRYCTNCQATSPCTSGGTGAMASRVNGAWNCSTGGSSGGGSTCTKYVALVTQSGTSAPTATVLENGLSGTPALTRNGAGDYSVTLAGAFPVATTAVFFGLALASIGDVSGAAVAVSLVEQDADHIRIYVGAGLDDSLSQTACEVRVYD